MEESLQAVVPVQGVHPVRKLRCRVDGFQAQETGQDNAVFDAHDEVHGVFQRIERGPAVLRHGLEGHAALPGSHFHQGQQQVDFLLFAGKVEITAGKGASEKLRLSAEHHADGFEDLQYGILVEAELFRAFKELDKFRGIGIASSGGIPDRLEMLLVQHSLSHEGKPRLPSAEENAVVLAERGGGGVRDKGEDLGHIGENREIKALVRRVDAEFGKKVSHRGAKETVRFGLQFGGRHAVVVEEEEAPLGHPAVELDPLAPVAQRAPGCREVLGGESQQDHVLLHRKERKGRSAADNRIGGSFEGGKDQFSRNGAVDEGVNVALLSLPLGHPGEDVLLGVGEPDRSLQGESLLAEPEDHRGGSDRELPEPLLGHLDIGLDGGDHLEEVGVHDPLDHFIGLLEVDHSVHGRVGPLGEGIERARPSRGGDDRNQEHGEEQRG